jgi:galactokinase
MRDEVVATAPGRVNLIGEHTDYHHGYVLPLVIPQRTRVRVRDRSDRVVCAHSSAMTDATHTFAIGEESRQRTWVDYLQGVTVALTRAGHHIGGFDVDIESAVPTGAGVSSSAALEVSVLRALRRLFDLCLDDVAIAKMAWAAETDFVGVPVGIMDQMVSSVGRDREALFLDTRELRTEHVPLPSSLELIVIDSGVRHAHAGGEYGTRRRESFEASAALGVKTLRDVDAARRTRLASLPPLLMRRARHIVTENDRVLDAVVALRDGDLPRLGALFRASHTSMRDDFETSTSEIDALVRIADEEPDVYGSRLTGGGFGGAVVILTKAGNAADVASRICERYRHDTACPGSVLMPSG